MRFETPEGERAVDAGQVILAMPKRSLEQIDCGTLASRANLNRLLNSVMPVPVFKLCLAYREPGLAKMADEHTMADSSVDGRHAGRGRYLPPSGWGLLTDLATLSAAAGTNGGRA